MKPILYLKQGEVVLGTLGDDGGDFPWYHCTFEPTEAFEGVKPLFDRELELAEAEDWEQWEQVYLQIEALGLRLVAQPSAAEINEFLLHIQGDKAWFRA